MENRIDFNEIKRLDQHPSKISTKKELRTLLNQYKKVLQKPFFEYLEALIEVEFSVIRDEISDDERLVLSELEIYKKIATYNIYNHVLSLNDHDNLLITDDLENLSICYPLPRGSIRLFNFDYHEYPPYKIKENIPEGYKSTKIGDIYLYQTINDLELCNLEKERISTKLKKLYEMKEEYDKQLSQCSLDNLSRVLGMRNIPSSYLVSENLREISEYERRLMELNQSDLSNKDIIEIATTNDFYNMIIGEYGLTNDCFEEPQKSSVTSKEASIMKKTLIKRMPNLNVYHEIKYI